MLTRKGKVLAHTIELFDDAWKQSLGLICRKPQPDTAYVFSFEKEQRSHFHMFLVFHTIDLFLLDKRKKVVDLKKRFLPFTIYKPRKPFFFAVEAKAGLLDLRVGDVIQF